MEYGRRLLPQAVDHYAATDPARVYASIPRCATSLSDGFRDITMAHLATMVNHFARWIDTRLSLSALQTIGYVGPTDIRYAVMFLAAAKARLKILFISPRNRPSQNSSMLNTSECKALFHANEVADVVCLLRQTAQDIPFMNVPSLDDFLQTPGDTAHYSYDKTFDQAQDDPCLILHSSGSTGDPKLVTLTHGTFSVIDNDRNVPVPEGRIAQNAAVFNFEGGGKFYSCFPPYHRGGVHAYIDLPIFSTSATVVFGPTNLPPSGYLLSEILKTQTVCAFYVPPSIIEQWSVEPLADEQAKSLKFIFYGGGPLSPQVGDKLSQITHVCQLYGSLETGQLQLLVPREGEWSWLELNPYEECDMQPAGDGCFELVLHQHPKFRTHRSLWHNFPGVKTWRTGDLFVPHPSKQGLWRFHSRVDDMIVLSSSHKIRPSHMELIIQGNSLLSGALIVGQGKPAPLLILEPRVGAYDGCSSDHFIDRVWATVKAANEIAPTYAHIARHHIIIAPTERPFARTPKGSIVRKVVVNEYAVEIEAAFAGEPSHVTSNGATLGRGIDDYLLQSVKTFVREQIEDHLPGVSLWDTDNIFVHGLDSLRTANLTKSLQEGLSSRIQSSSGSNSVSLRMIYKYPTIESLSEVIFHLLFGGHIPDIRLGSDANEMEMIVNELTKDLPVKATETPGVPNPGEINVAVLGPRGSLGPNIVKELLANRQIGTVYCLNRGTDGKEKIQNLFQDRHWQYDADSQRLVFMPIDLNKPRLGLSDKHYEELLNNVNIIVHNAWKVNFSWTIESFRSEYLRSVRELIDLSSRSPLSPRIVFISSVSSVQNWSTVYSTPVAEMSLPSYEVASPLGYGQSKHVAERILEKASEVSGTRVTIIRVGQLAGPTTPSGGIWSTEEWIPSMAVISRTLKLVPSNMPPIDWVPVDLAARAICELAMTRSKGGADNHLGGTVECDGQVRIFNIVNPRPSEWSCFVVALQQRLADRVEQAPLDEWLAAIVQTDPNTMPEVEASLSARIIPFFQHVVETVAKGSVLQPQFETQKTVEASSTMAQMEAVNVDLIKLWLMQWEI